MNENLNKKSKPNAGVAHESEAFTYKKPMRVRCISNYKYEDKISKGEYVAVGECRDHFIIGRSMETLLAVIPKNRFEIV